MELTVSVVFGLFSILHSLTAGINAGKANTVGHVLFYSQHEQLFDDDLELQQFPRMKPEDEAKKFDEARQALLQKNEEHIIELTNDGKKILIVECVEYEKEAYTFLYTKERILVDKLELHYSKDVCKRVKDYISLYKTKEAQITGNDKYEMLEFTIFYPPCIKREYKIITFFYVAISEKKGVKKTFECLQRDKTDAAEEGSDGVNKIIKTWRGQGKYEIMDYIEGSPVGDSIVTPLINNPNFMIKCQQYNKGGEHANAIQDPTMYSGLIMYHNTYHVDQMQIEQYQVVDKFILDSCPTEDVGIYITELPVPEEEIKRDRVTNNFIILFREKNGKCFCRRVKQITFKQSKKIVTTSRTPPREIR